MTINLQQLKDTRPHFPVLIQEILDNLAIIPAKPQIFLDCTFGAGGYSQHILQYPNTQVIAIDRDETVLPIAQQLQNKYPNRLHFYLNVYSNYPTVLAEAGIAKVDGIIMDLGFSSMQINAKDRGFSFKNTDALLMTMGLNKTTAYEFINHASQELIADVLHYYGEERKAKQIAKKIINTRQHSPIITPQQLANIVRDIVGFKGKRIDPATKTFQAIRIYINDELKELKTALNNAYEFLNPNGKLLVVSFHSLEDRLVKEFLNANGQYQKKYESFENSEKFTKNKLNFATTNNRFEIITKKPIVPTPEEIAINPPSVSAKLRVARKI